MIDVRKLGMLAALQRLGTIAAVADELHISAPGVSMQLSALERELGLVLTERQGRRVMLTPAGVVLSAHGHDIVDRLSVAEFELDALRAGSVGHIRLAAFPSAARTFVADVYRGLVEGDSAEGGDDGGTGGDGARGGGSRGANAGGSSSLELTLTTVEPEPALGALSAGAVDLAVIHAYSNVPRSLPRGVSSRQIGTEAVWLAVSGGNGRLEHDRGAAHLEHFAATDWITPTPDVTCFDMVERACGLAGFRPRVVAETMDFAVQLELVAAGVGVALVPALTIAQVPPGVRLLRLESPVTRTLLLAARGPGFTDPSILNLAGRIEAAATARLAGAAEIR